MMSFEFYIQSRGRGQEHDYGWVKVTPKGQTPLEPSMLREKNIYELIQPNAFSVVLARYNNQLLLLINGLDANKERVDYQRRAVRHSVVCISSDSDDDEVVLRGLAAKALKDRPQMAKLVDRHLAFDSKEEEVGFKVDLALIEALRQFPVSKSESILSKDVTGQEDSEQLWPQLAADLETHQLPKQEGPLVVVTKFKDAQTLREAGVLRGVSELDSRDGQPPSSEQGVNKKIPTPPLVILALLVIIGVVATMYVINSTKPTIKASTTLTAAIAANSTQVSVLTTEIPEDTPTVTPNNTPTVTPNNTPTVTPNNTPTVTPDNTPTVTPDNTPTTTPEATPDQCARYKVVAEGELQIYSHAQDDKKQELLQVKKDDVFVNQNDLNSSDWIIIKVPSRFEHKNGGPVSYQYWWVKAGELKNIADCG